MTAPFAYRRTYRLGRIHSVTFELDANVGLLACHWVPDLPPARISRKLLPAYRRARADFLAGPDLPAAVIET